MLDQEVIKAAARRLHEAERNACQTRQISLDYPEITIDDAYAIQHQGIQLKLAEGRKISFY